MIGSRPPLLSDRTSMPYMEACQMETLRLISHVPLAVPHATIRDTVVQGKRIPKDTVVSISVCCHSDKVVYKKLNYRKLQVYGIIVPYIKHVTSKLPYNNTK